ncbi:MAG TPA: PAS domain S-box protein [Xanthobacteraceae bacterium]|nr:PAS domain S-box protein [Xanthobacteraceae bacterium]
MVREFDGTILHWTRGMERLYGWSRAEAIGRKSHELLQTVFPRPLADIEAELMGEGGWAGELVHTRRNGERLVAASHWSLWRRIIVEVDNDMTAERRALEARQYLANIVDSSDDAIIGKTLDGIITSWNQAAELMFGYAAEEVVGKPISILSPPDRLDEHVAIIEKIGRGARIEHFQTVRRRKDGVSVPVSLTISPIIGTDGRIIGASKIARDITERHQSQARLQEVQSELFHVSRLNTVSHMALGLAHEINQPLAAIVNYLKGAQRLLGERADDLSTTLRSALGAASEQALRAGEVVRRLRNFMARGETEFSVESLSQLVRETSQLVLLGANDVHVAFRLDAGRDRVLINRIQVQQVLINLIRNACEAMEGGARRELTIASAAADSEMVEVGVIDTGPGIPAEVAAQLFQPFVTTKRQGMGVGLSISKTIIEAHGGRIWIAPNPAGGAIFRFTLPLVSGTDE